jgi:hypothetical protein
VANGNIYTVEAETGMLDVHTPKIGEIVGENRNHAL